MTKCIESNDPHPQPQKMWSYLPHIRKKKNQKKNQKKIFVKGNSSWIESQHTENTQRTHREHIQTHRTHREHTENTQRTHTEECPPLPAIPVRRPVPLNKYFLLIFFFDYFFFFAEYAGDMTHFLPVADVGHSIRCISHNDSAAAFLMSLKVKIAHRRANCRFEDSLENSQNARPGMFLKSRYFYIQRFFQLFNLFIIRFFYWFIFYLIWFCFYFYLYYYLIYFYFYFYLICLLILFDIIWFCIYLFIFYFIYWFFIYFIVICYYYLFFF